MRAAFLRLGSLSRPSPRFPHTEPLLAGMCMPLSISGLSNDEAVANRLAVMAFPSLQGVIELQSGSPKPHRCPGLCRALCHLEQGLPVQAILDL